MISGRGFAWPLWVAGAAALAVLAVHIALFGFVAERLALPAGALVAVAVLGLANHLGLFAFLARRKSRREPPPT